MSVLVFALPALPGVERAIRTPAHNGAAQIKTWLRYIGSKREALPTIRYQLYERALKIMPGRCGRRFASEMSSTKYSHAHEPRNAALNNFNFSYKLWYKYLAERRRDVKNTSPADPARKEARCDRLAQFQSKLRHQI